MATDPDNLTPPEAARRLRMSVQRIKAMIRSGELRAWNGAANRLTDRPRYRIPRAAIEAYEESRMVLPLPKLKRRRTFTDDAMAELEVNSIAELKEQLGMTKRHTITDEAMQELEVGSVAELKRRLGMN